MTSAQAPCVAASKDGAAAAGPDQEVAALVPEEGITAPALEQGVAAAGRWLVGSGVDVDCTSPCGPGSRRASSNRLFLPPPRSHDPGSDLRIKAWTSAMSTPCCFSQTTSAEHKKKKEILSLSTDKQQARKSNIGKIKFTCGHPAQPRRQEGLLSFFSVQAVKALHGRCHDGLHDARCHLPEVATPQAGQLAMLKLRVTFSA